MRLAREDAQDLEIPGGIDLEGGAGTVPENTAALARRPIQKAICSLNERTVRIEAISVEDERVQNRDRASHWVELVNSAEATLVMDVAKSPACARGAVEIPVACLNGWPSRTASVTACKPSSKRVQHREVSGWAETENSAGTTARRLAALRAVPEVSI